MMTINEHNINKKDRDYLDDFLQERIDDKAGTREKDKGIQCLSALDGLLTAVNTGPAAIPSSRWLVAVWGDFEPKFRNSKKADKVISVMTNMMNSNAATLMQSPQAFEPLFNHRKKKGKKGKKIVIVDEWCDGYMRGVALLQDLWDDAGVEMRILLTPIRAFTRWSDWQAHNLPSDAQVANIQNAISPNVQAIHAYWRERREEFDPVITTEPQEPQEPQEPKPVRPKDPCPCGSGKKYKKCCMP